MSSSRKAAGEVTTSVILSTFRLNGLLLEAGDRLSAEHGLTSARWQVLGAISLSDRPLTVPQIARRMGLTRQSVHATVDRLVGNGLIELIPNDDHVRSQLVRLTAAGEEAYRVLDRHQTAWVGELADDIPRSDLEMALTVLDELDQPPGDEPDRRSEVGAGGDGEGGEMTPRTVRKAERAVHLFWGLVIALYVYGLLPSWGEPVLRWVVVPGIVGSGFAMWFAAPLRRAARSDRRFRCAARTLSPGCITMRTLAVIAAVGFVAIAVFQAALAFGAPLGRAAWGGTSDPISHRACGSRAGSRRSSGYSPQRSCSPAPVSARPSFPTWSRGGGRGSSSSCSPWGP